VAELSGGMESCNLEKIQLDENQLATSQKSGEQNMNKELIPEVCIISHN